MDADDGLAIGSFSPPPPPPASTPPVPAPHPTSHSPVRTTHMSGATPPPRARYTALTAVFLKTVVPGRPLPRSRASPPPQKKKKWGGHRVRRLRAGTGCGLVRFLRFREAHNFLLLARAVWLG